FLAATAGEDAMVSETRAPDGSLVARSFVPKLDPAATAASPEASIVTMLAQGQVNDKPITTLARTDDVVLTPNGAGTGWAASIQAAPPPPTVPWSSFTPVTAEGHRNSAQRSSSSSWAFLAVTFAIYGLLFGLIRRARRGREVRRVLAPAMVVARPQAPRFQ